MGRQGAYLPTQEAPLFPRRSCPIQVFFHCHQQQCGDCLLYPRIHHGNLQNTNISLPSLIRSSSFLPLQSTHPPFISSPYPSSSAICSSCLGSLSLLILVVCFISDYPIEFLSSSTSASSTHPSAQGTLSHPPVILAQLSR